MITIKQIFKTALTILICIEANGLSAQTLEWAKSMGGNGDDRGRSITVDASGNVYTTGWFDGTVDFDPGAGTANLTTMGNFDVFIQKLDSSGDFLWVKSFGASSIDDPSSIKIDDSGNIYTTGFFRETVDFDPGAGIANLSVVGSSDVFVQKLDASGNFLWARSFGGSAGDRGRSITVDDSGNLYTTGSFRQTADFDPGASTTNLTAIGSSDIFVQKLDASGNFLWARSFGGSTFDDGFSITVDTSGNIYTTGYFEGTVDFDPGAGTANLISAGKDAFVLKLDPSGNFIWAKSFGGSSSEYGQAITIDPSGNIYTTGYFEGTVDFDPGAGTASLNSVGDVDAFVQKLDASGNFLWAKSFGGGTSDRGESITIDALGDVYVTGYFEGTVDFDPGAGTANLNSIGSEDIFVQKLDASGNFLWAKSFGDSSNDRGESITVDPSGNLYATGFFQETADFDPGAITTNLTANGVQDVYVQKMSQGGVIGIMDMGKGVQIKAYPNPSKGLVQITFEQALKNVEIRVTDLQGKIVFTKHLDAVIDQQIDLDGTSGIYFLSVRTPQGQSVVKLIKE